MSEPTRTRQEKKQQPEDLRKLTVTIAIVLGIAALFLALKRPPFRLGLDLQGGSRYVFRLNPDEEQVSVGEDPQSLYFETQSIIRERVDPDGTLEPVIRLESDNDRLIVELPGLDELQGKHAKGLLQDPIDDSVGVGSTISLQDGYTGEFPPDGGTLLVGAEQIDYSRFDGTSFVIEQRGALSTPITDHVAGSDVELISTNAILNRIQNLGKLSFEIKLRDGDDSATILSEAGTTLGEERAKLDAWLEQNPAATTLAAFNRLPAEEGGPNAAVRWVPEELRRDAEGRIADTRTLGERAVPLMRHKYHPTYAEEDWTFTGDRLARVFGTQNQMGLPAVGFEIRPEHASKFGRFTGTFTNNQMAIVLNEEVVTSPNLNSRIDQNGIIEGDFTNEEVRELVQVLRTGSLRLRPELEHEERVGPTLGAGYVKRGWVSGLMGIAVVLVFMAVYYRRLGMIAGLSLSANIFLLMAGLSVMDATLTLPGIAGIILTVGMAVDANILIFDRVREEMDNGRNIKQAAKNGFDKAFVTIIDANLTTLLTAIVLFIVGTGPVKGFAVTLMIGILTSLFAALVITRVLVQFSLARGTKAFPMGRWMVEANYDWMGKTKLAMTVSAVAIVAGLTLFTVLPEKDKFGIDFLGGVELQLRTEEGQTAQVIRDRLAEFEGDLGQAEVRPVLASQVEGDRYTEFRLTFKSVESSASEGGGEFEEQVRRDMGDLLQRGPIELTDPSGEALRLYFDEVHPESEIAGRLETLGLTEVAVAEDPERPRAYDVTAALPGGLDPLTLQSQIQTAFKDQTDSNGREYVLATAVPSSTTVGAQVVGELRDKAVLAILVSLFAIVLYIRARFAEYSFGFAAVIAVVHDVLITLGVISLFLWLGLLNLELNLSMIAAFLTIIGYSLNDTIVIFDRIRENRPRMEAPLREVLNVSINQTLSRTILTSITTIFVVVILFAANVRTGNTLEGFSFAMLVGLIAGTYSTIFIASPALEFFERRHAERLARARSAAPATAETKKAPASV